MAAESTSCKIYIKGLPSDIDEKKLEGAFGRFGRIMESNIVRDHGTSVSRGFGFIRFECHEDCLDAIRAMNGKELDGHTLTVSIAVDRDGSGQGPARGGGIRGGGRGGPAGRFPGRGMPFAQGRGGYSAGRGIADESGQSMAPSYYGARQQNFPDRGQLNTFRGANRGRGTPHGTPPDFQYPQNEYMQPNPLNADGTYASPAEGYPDAGEEMPAAEPDPRYPGDGYGPGAGQQRLGYVNKGPGMPSAQRDVGYMDSEPEMFSDQQDTGYNDRMQDTPDMNSQPAFRTGQSAPQPRLSYQAPPQARTGYQTAPRAQGGYQSPEQPRGGYPMESQQTQDYQMGRQSRGGYTARGRGQSMMGQPSGGYMSRGGMQPSPGPPRYADQRIQAPTDYMERGSSSQWDAEAGFDQSGAGDSAGMQVYPDYDNEAAVGMPPYNQEFETPPQRNADPHFNRPNTAFDSREMAASDDGYATGVSGYNVPPSRQPQKRVFPNSSQYISPESRNYGPVDQPYDQQNMKDIDGEYRLSHDEGNRFNMESQIGVGESFGPPGGRNFSSAGVRCGLGEGTYRKQPANVPGDRYDNRGFEQSDRGFMHSDLRNAQPRSMPESGYGLLTSSEFEEVPEGEAQFQTDRFEPFADNTEQPFHQGGPNRYSPDSRNTEYSSRFGRLGDSFGQDNRLIMSGRGNIQERLDSNRSFGQSSRSDFRTSQPTLSRDRWMPNRDQVRMSVERDHPRAFNSIAPDASAQPMNLSDTRSVVKGCGDGSRMETGGIVSLLDLKVDMESLPATLSRDRSPSSSRRDDKGRDSHYRSTHGRSPSREVRRFSPKGSRGMPPSRSPRDFPGRGMSRDSRGAERRPFPASRQDDSGQPSTKRALGPSPPARSSSPRGVTHHGPRGRRF